MRRGDSDTAQQRPSGNADERKLFAGEKKPFIEPEIKEFDDLEKQIKAPLVGVFTPG